MCWWVKCVGMCELVGKLNNGVGVYLYVCTFECCNSVIYIQIIKGNIGYLCTRFKILNLIIIITSSSGSNSNGGGGGGSGDDN